LFYSILRFKLEEQQRYMERSLNIEMRERKVQGTVY
jgi:hypothetical protein